jgi:hypothetical protein
MRRDARLHELRDEISALLATLSKPVAPVAKDVKVQSIRSRLALEPSRSRQLSLDGELF